MALSSRTKSLSSWLLLAALLGAFAWFARPHWAPARAAGHVHPPGTYAQAPGNLPRPFEPLRRAHEVRLVHFVPADREPEPGWAERIRVLALFADEFLRRDLAAKGFATDGLDFASDGDGALVELVRGARPALDYRTAAAHPADAHDHGEHDAHFWNVLEEVAAALGPAQERLYLIFTDTSERGEPCFDAHGNLARGAILSPDGGAVVVSAWVASELVCAPDAETQLALFDDETPTVGAARADGSRVEAPRFEFVEDAFGTVAHELCHALGCLHDRRTPQEDLMGLGTRNFRPGYRGMSDAQPRVWISPQNALFLRNSRFLADDVDWADREAPELEGRLLGDLRAGATEVGLSVEVRDERELAALLFFSPRHDTLLAGVEAHGGRFIYETPIAHPPLEKGPLDIAVYAVDRGGSFRAILLRGEVE